MKTKYPYSLFVLSALALVATLSNFGPLRAAEDPFQMNVRPTEPLTPEKQLKKFHVPPGFEVQLVAADPEINKVTNLNFDAKGRLWIVNTLEYPWPVKDAAVKPRDTIRVLEDFGPNGKAGKISVFADGLNIPLGLWPYRGGVIAHSIPNIWRITDTDGDGKADKMDKMYGPVGTKDTHGMVNSFRRGFDGWIYATHGFSNTSELTGTDGKTLKMTSGNTFRMALDGSHVEIFTNGQTNPYGLCWDPLGNLYSADCHSSPLYMLLHGGYYASLSPRHDGLGFVPVMCSHTHGSTGIGGVVYYNDDKWPDEYKGSMFCCNVVTSRIHRDTLIETGSTRIAKDAGDFVNCDDPWFRPVDIQLGPDGAFYIADFYNRIIGHYEVKLDHPGRDRTRGRIWRVVYTGKGAQPVKAPDLTALNVDDLTAKLSDPNLTVRLLTTNELVDRFGKDAIAPATKALKSDNAFQRAHALWVLERLGALELDALTAALKDADRHMRVHAMRILTERQTWKPEERALALAGLKDADAFVQRCSVDALGRHPQEDQTAPVMELMGKVPAGDSYLLYVVKQSLKEHLKIPGLLPKLAESADANTMKLLADIAKAVTSPESAIFLLASAKKIDDGPKRWVDSAPVIGQFGSEELCNEFITLAKEKLAKDNDGAGNALKGMNDGRVRAGKGPSPAMVEWGTAVVPALQGMPANGGRTKLINDVAGGLKIVTSAAPLLDALGKKGGDVNGRAEAAKSLAKQGSKHLPAITKVLVDGSEPIELREKITQTLSESSAPEARTAVSESMKTLPMRLQIPFAQGWSANAEGAEALLKCVAEGKASPHLLLDTRVSEQLNGLKNEKITARVAELTKGLEPANKEIQNLIDQRIKAFDKGKADVAKGVQVFEKNCMVCHQIAGKGAVVGPQLDGVGRRGLDRIVEDILDPNRNVDPIFKTSLIAMNEGGVISGFVRRDEGEVLIIVDSTGKELQVAKKDIKARRDTSNSLMLTTFKETITPEDFNHLLAYLLSTGQ